MASCNIATRCALQGFYKQRATRCHGMQGLFFRKMRFIHQSKGFDGSVLTVPKELYHKERCCTSRQKVVRFEGVSQLGNSRNHLLHCNHGHGSSPPLPSSLHSPTYSYRTPTGLPDSYWILLGLQQISYGLITIQIWYPSPTGVLVHSYWNH